MSFSNRDIERFVRDMPRQQPEPIILRIVRNLDDIDVHQLLRDPMGYKARLKHAMCRELLDRLVAELKFEVDLDLLKRGMPISLEITVNDGNAYRGFTDSARREGRHQAQKEARDATPYGLLDAADPT